MTLNKFKEKIICGSAKNIRIIDIRPTWDGKDVTYDRTFKIEEFYNTDFPKSFVMDDGIIISVCPETIQLYIYIKDRGIK